MSLTISTSAALAMNAQAIPTYLSHTKTSIQLLLLDICNGSSGLLGLSNNDGTIQHSTR